MNGFSLIEVIIALTLFSFALINLHQEKHRLYRSLQQNYYRTLAMNQCLGLADRYRANKGSRYQLRELTAWSNETGTILPNGKGNIDCHHKICHILVRWGKNQQEQLGLTFRL